MATMAHDRLGQVLRHIRHWVGGRDAPAEGTDDELLHRFVQERDAAAFTALAQRHAPLVWGVCRRILREPHAAEDAFQATFVILARRAAAISRRAALSSWLYGVAYRVAVRARVTERRRQEREKNDMRDIADPAAHADPAARLAWQEACTVLDEELNRLPEKYRAPLVLCYLRGKTNEEAAGELQCPTGTMSWRLAQARDRLRARLAQRGVALSAAGLAAFLAEGAATAQVPRALFQNTIQVALAGGSLSTEVAALVQGVVHMLWATKMKKLAAAALFVCLVGGGLSLATYRSLSNAAPLPPAEAKKEEPAAGPTVNGLKLSLSADKAETVMKPDGKNAEPVALKLTITNVSDKPIKLDAYDFWWTLLRGDVTPPNADSIRVGQLAVDRVRRPAEAKDYPEIKAGQSWTFAENLKFPGSISVGNDTANHYTVLKPGAFKVKYRYVAPKANTELAKGAWNGELASNELTITVKPAEKRGDAGPAVKGLQLTLAADQTETVMNAEGTNAEPVRVRLTFTNVSDQPIKLDAHHVWWRLLRGEVTPRTADSLRVNRYALNPPTKAQRAEAKDYPEIKPGESWSFSQMLYSDTLRFPGVIAEDNSGGVADYAVLKPGAFKVKFRYVAPEADTELAKGAWSGALVSNELTITVKPAEKRAEALPAIKGLQLTAAVDKTQTFINPDGTTEPVRFTLTLTNVSAQPIKLDTHDFYYSRLRGTAVSEAADSLTNQGIRYAAIDRTVPQPKAADYPELQPKEQWKFDTNLTFPSALPQADASVAYRRYSVLRPGVFKVQFTYTTELAVPNAFSKGACSGVVVSNELAITVKQAGAAFNGLRLTLSADNTETAMKADGSNAEPVNLALTFSNVSDKPIKLDTYDFTASHCRLEVSGPDGDSVQTGRALVNRGIMPPSAGAVLPVIQPGQSYTQAVTGLMVYDPFVRDQVARADPLAFPGAFYQPLGNRIDYTLKKPGAYRLKWTYRNDAQNKANENKTWAGELTSNEFVLQVKPGK